MGAGKVLVTVAQLYNREAEYLRRLEAAGLDVERRIGQGGRLTEDELIDALPGVFATLASSEPYTERVFRAAPDLRVIGRWGVGYDAIDVPSATRHGVLVCTAVGTNHEAVADYAVALMGALQRGLLRNHRLITQGQWRTVFHPAIWRATVGIVGLGRIGQAVARRCRGIIVQNSVGTLVVDSVGVGMARSVFSAIRGRPSVLPSLLALASPARTRS